MGEIQRVAKFLMVNVIGGNERLNNSYEGKNKYNKTRGDNED
jgi:hypothetical protein